MAIKRIAFLVFPRLTFLDFVGAYDVLRRIAAMSIDPAVTHRIIGTEPEIIDETGLVMKPDAVYEDLASFDLLYVPGGFGTRTLMDDKHLLDYLKTWASERPLASACTGAPLPARAAYLPAARAPTHHRAL